MADTRTLKIIVTGDSRDGQRAVRDLGNQSEQVERRVGALGRAFGALGPTVLSGIAGLGIIGGFERTIGAASDLNETVSKTKTIFAGQYDTIARWAENAERSMGLSTRAALDGASTFANFFKQVGIGGPKVAEMSKRFVELSSDFASFHNAQPAEVMEALSAATRGEYDALQKYVPTVNAAAIETRALADTGKESAKSLTLAEKATALYSLVLKDGGAAIGDFGRTSSGAANQQRILTATIEEQGAAIGNTLLPAYTALLSGINSVGPVYAAAGIAALVFGSKIQQGAQVAQAGLTGYIARTRQAAAESAAAGTRFALLRASIASVGTAAVAGGTAMKGLLGLVGGPYGLAIAAATLGLGYFINKHQKAKAAEEAHRTAMEGLTKAVQANNGVIDESVRKSAAEELNKKKALDQAKLLGIQTYALTEAYLKGGKALDDQIKIVDENAAALQRQREAMFDSGATAIDMETKLRPAEEANRALKETLVQQRDAMKASSKEAEKLGAATTQQAEKSSILTETTKNLSVEERNLFDVLYKLGKETKTNVDAADDLKDAWDKLTGAAQSQEEAINEYNETAIEFRDGLKAEKKALDDAQDSLKGKTGADRKAALAALSSAKEEYAGAKALDARTTAGIKARKAIADVAQASKEQMLADIRAGVPAAKALEAHNKRIEAHRQEAIKAGQSRAAVDSLFKLYGKPPDDVALALKVTGDKEAAAKLRERLIQQQALRDGIPYLKAREDYPKGSTGYAGGGAVKGPGTSTSDQAGLYRLSNKEFVIQAEMADAKYGHDAMHDLNQGRIPADIVKNWRSYAMDGLAGGGPVWNQRTKGTWPHPITEHNAWVPSEAQAAKAVGGFYGNGNIMGWQNQVAWARSKFPGIGVYSTFRNGSRTLSGNLSYHASGRAVDFEPKRALAVAIKETFGKNIKELITPWLDLMIWHGKPHKFSKAIENQHGVGAAGNDHVHWAMDNGGVLPPRSTTTITNATRESEYALTRSQLKEVAGVNIENLNVTVNGNIPSADAQRIAVQIRNELTKVAGRNGGRAGLPSK